MGLEKLSVRRERNDMVEVYKIINNVNNVRSDTWFKLVGDQPERATRSTSYHKNFRTDIRKNFFLNRVVSKWNSLPEIVKESTSVQSFKFNLKKLTT